MNLISGASAASSSYFTLFKRSISWRKQAYTRLARTFMLHKFKFVHKITAFWGKSIRKSYNSILKSYKNAERAKKRATEVTLF